MHILNVMLSKGGGGIESAFADYATMLIAQGHSITCCTSPEAFIISQLPHAAAKLELSNNSQFDPLAVLRAGLMLRRNKFDIILTHGKRAFQLFVLARKLFAPKVKLVNVLHRHRYKNLKAADCIITVSRAIREEAIKAGMPQERVVHIPNALMSVPDAQPKPFQAVPVLGVLGRFVPEKGVDIFISALALLKKRNIAFRARIAGEGAMQFELRQQAVLLELDNHIEWLGWVNDVPAFYESIDIFCMSSRAESFGLALLNAMAYAKPVVSTRTIGPSEFLVHGKNALLCDFTPDAVADAVMDMLATPARSATLAMAARETALLYSSDTVGKQLDACLQEMLRYSA